MNPSEREIEEYIILYDEEEEQQPGSTYTRKCYKRVKTQQDIIPTILALSKYRNCKGFQVFILGKQLKDKWA